ncbi:hypothetical protein LCGC14_1268970 [marine sediment metagenome]|uniref:ArnR1-like winged helix-turn-helix domain-containing protein n=1 Tax=marine sediment metagenome TaxID=412755 RepID=A0A0F9KYM4_9ZZZZ
MRRDSKDIDAAILRIAETRVKKTQIVYQANLNFKIVKRYLARLIDDQGYLEQEDDLFQTTTRGKEFLLRYDALTSLDIPQPLLSV